MIQNQFKKVIVNANFLKQRLNRFKPRRMKWKLYKKFYFYLNFLFLSEIGYEINIHRTELKSAQNIHARSE